MCAYLKSALISLLHLHASLLQKQFNEPVTPFNSLLEYFCLVNIPMDKVIILWQAILKIFTDLKYRAVGKMLLENNTKLLLLCFQINFKKVEHFKFNFLEDELL